MIRVIDIESSDMPPRPAAICEIGWTDIARFDSGWSVGKTFSALTNPGMKIEWGAMATHHIQQSMVDGLPSAAETMAAHEVLTAAGIEAFACHFAKFECGFIEFPKPVICTWKCAMHLAPHLSSHSNQALRYALKLDVNPDRAQPAHRAGPDTHVTAHLLARILTKLSIEEAIAISSRPVLLYRCPINASLIGAGRNDPKQKDLTFDQIDAGYLRWMIDNVKDNEDLTFTAMAELERRSGQRQRIVPDGLGDQTPIDGAGP